MTEWELAAWERLSDEALEAIEEAVMETVTNGATAGDWYGTADHTEAASPEIKTTKPDEPDFRLLRERLLIAIDDLDRHARRVLAEELSYLLATRSLSWKGLRERLLEMDNYLRAWRG